MAFGLWRGLWVVGGMAGWNARPWVLGAWLGTLLGPEETPVCGVFFLVAAPGLGRLTHPDARVSVGGCGGGWWGWGVVVC